MIGSIVVPKEAGIILALAAAWLLWRTNNNIENIASGLSGGFKKFSEGLNFDPKTLGKTPPLTPSAKQREQAMIDEGYLERLADGRTRITVLGRQYINEQLGLDHE